MNPPLTPRQAQVYKELHNAYQHPTGSVLQVAKKLEVSPIAIRRWIERFQQRGYITIDPPLGETKMRFNNRNVTFHLPIPSDEFINQK